MSKETQEQVIAQEKVIQEERKVKALEKIAMSLDALTVWFKKQIKTNGDIDFNSIQLNGILT